MIKKISVILILLSVSLVYAQKEINVISSDHKSLLIEYTPGLDTSSVIINFEKFYKLDMPGAQFPGVPGVPSIPFISIPVGVPSEFGNTIEVIQTSHVLVTGKVVPEPSIIRDNNLTAYEHSIGDSYYDTHETELVSFGEFGFLREMPLQNIIVRPAEYNPSIQQIKLYTRILFRISFSSEQIFTQGTTEDKMIKGTVVNYNISKSWVKAPDRLRKVQTNSVLAEGKWYRFEAPEEGIYRINRNQLVSYGIDAASVDPRTIKIYNNSGRTLPESVLAPAPYDLVENAILIIGEEDGKFDEADYILFYGRGTSFWEYDSLAGRIERRHNIYSKENYFWITSGGAPGKRMQNKTSEQSVPDLVQNTSEDFRFLEEDKINIVRSGRVFLGDEFNESVKSRTYMNRLDHRIPGTPVNYEFRFVNSDERRINLRIEEQQSTVFDSIIGGIGNVPDEPSYSTGNPLFNRMSTTVELPENRSVLKFTFNASGSVSKGYLDFFEIRYMRSLSAIDDEIIFYASAADGVIEYSLNNFSSSNDINAFDISTYSDVKIIRDPLYISAGEYKFRSVETAGRGGKYLALRANKYRTPVNAVPAENSNLHGVEGAEYIIITHRNFIQQAEVLREHRSNYSRYPLTSIVVNIDAIYNEFGGGLKDITAIRNFIKYAYDNWTIRPEYVVLFGDGDYDYKNTEGFGRNFIPAYHIHVQHPETYWRNIHRLWSYPLDDYYVRVSGDDPFIDAAIGRMNIQSTADAQRVVDKVIKYESDSEKGNWRNLVTLVADDAYTSKDYEGTRHVGAQETIADRFIPGSFDINKIYLSLYPVEHTSLGKRKPAVTKALVDGINRGTVLLSFMGHGSPNVWTHEVVYDKSTTTPLLKNDKFFFLMVYSCDFGYFDNPSEQSGTEVLMLKENSGTIGAFTASRPTFSGDNEALAKELFRTIFTSPREENQLPISVGEVYLRLRAKRFQTNDLKYHLFGDPAVRLAIPQYPAEISHINGQTTTQPVQVQALGKVTVEGFIKKDSVNLWEDYNGEGIISVYDSYRSVTLLDVNYQVRVQGGLIFRGIVSVTNGRFSAEFTVPKDISYEDRNGRISLYFYSPGNDGITAVQNIFFSGTDSTAVNDGKGPVVEIYFDNTEYKNAFLVNPNSELIVKLSDETGLNTTGTGVGHRLEGVLNENLNEPIDFSGYFTGDKDAGGKSGEVRYRFTDLAEGDHKIQVKAWDVFNNYSSKSEYFSVVNSGDLELRDIYNYPNPFRETTTFTFQQNLKTTVDVKIKIYTIAGRMIRELERTGINEGFVNVDWDGRDQDGDRIANGTYFYKVIVTSADGEFSRSALGKLAVIY